MEGSAIVVAAGKSTRANYIDKNFLKIHNKFIVEYSIEIFESVEEIKEIILVLNENNYTFGEKLKEKYKKLILTKGGSFRAESVKNGVMAAKYKHLLIHDGARPFITKELVKKILENLENFSCVIPVIPVRQTIKEVENGFVNKTLDRNKLFEVQTPEGFYRDDLISLYETFEINEEIFDESILFEKKGIKIKTIPGIFENIKLTTPFDLMVAEVMILKWK